MIIDIINRKWRAVRLHDEASIRYLNKLFRLGWSVVPLGMDDIPWLILKVPLQTPGRTTFNNEYQVLEALSSPSATIVILRMENRRDQFRAVVLSRNESGYAAADAAMLDTKEWKPIALEMFEGGLGYELYQRV